VRLLRARSLLLGATPPELRQALRKGRDQLQRFDSRLRSALPEALGGRFSQGALICRPLTDDDLPSFAGRPGQPKQVTLGPRCFGIGVVLHGELIAWGLCVGLGPRDEEPLEHVLLMASYVLPKFRRRGVARRLIAARLETAAARGARVAFVRALKNNGASIAALEASGFERVAPAQEPAWLEGARADQVLLTYSLERVAAAVM